MFRGFLFQWHKEAISRYVSSTNTSKVLPTMSSHQNWPKPKREVWEPFEKQVIWQPPQSQRTVQGPMCYSQAQDDKTKYLDKQRINPQQPPSRSTQENYHQDFQLDHSGRPRVLKAVGVISQHNEPFGNFGSQVPHFLKETCTLKTVPITESPVEIAKQMSKRVVNQKATNPEPKVQASKTVQKVGRNDSSEPPKKKMKMATKPVKFVNMLKPAKKLPRPQFEMNELMKEALEEELVGVVDTIRKTFPEMPVKPVDGTIKEIVNKDMGRIREMMGLFLAQRILNVHNELLVKIKFNHIPPKEVLDAFVSMHSLHDLKGLPDSDMKGVYTARCVDFSDYDTICAKPRLTFDRFHVTITPQYMFGKRPKNLGNFTLRRDNLDALGDNKNDEGAKKTVDEQNKGVANMEIVKTEKASHPNKTKEVLAVKRVDAKKTADKQTEVVTNMEILKTEKAGSLEKIKVKIEDSKKTVDGQLKVIVKSEEVANPDRTEAVITAKETKENAVKVVANKEMEYGITDKVTDSDKTMKETTQIKKIVDGQVKEVAIQDIAKTDKTFITMKETEENVKEKPENSVQRKMDEPSSKTEMVTDKRNVVKESTLGKRNVPKKEEANAASLSKIDDKQISIKSENAKKEGLSEKSEENEIDGFDFMELMGSAIILDECIGSDED